ncbi:MAG: Holliday junction resolvase RuvX [Candidatus Brocadiia bacterium]
MALDHGERRIGVAVSDPLGIAAHAVTTIDAGERGTQLDELCDLVQARNVKKIVVGMPVMMSGEEGARARQVRSFLKELRRRIPGVPVETIDERLTSAQAHRSLSEQKVNLRERKRRVDQVAAQMILRRYLNRIRSQNSGSEEK